MPDFGLHVFVPASNLCSRTCCAITQAVIGVIAIGCLTDFQFVIRRHHDFKNLVWGVLPIAIGEIIAHQRRAAGIGAGQKSQVKGVGTSISRQKPDRARIGAVRTATAVAPDVHIVTRNRIQPGHGNRRTGAGYEYTSGSGACAGARRETDRAVFHQKTAGAARTGETEIGGSRGGDRTRNICRSTANSRK